MLTKRCKHTLCNRIGMWVVENQLCPKRVLASALASAGSLGPWNILPDRSVFVCREFLPLNSLTMWYMVGFWNLPYQFKLLEELETKGIKQNLQEWSVTWAVCDQASIKALDTKSFDGWQESDGWHIVTIGSSGRMMCSCLEPPPPGPCPMHLSLWLTLIWFWWWLLILFVCAVIKL